MGEKLERASRLSNWRMIRSELLSLDSKYGTPANQQWNTPKNSKAAINETPGKRDAPDRAGDESKGDNSGTGNQAERDHPLIANGIDVGANECDGDDEVSKCEPIGAVGEERIAAIGSRDAFIDAFDPGENLGEFGNRSKPPRAKEGNKPTELRLEGEGCNATENEADDEDSQPEANATKLIILRHHCKKSSELWARTSRWAFFRSDRIGRFEPSRHGPLLIDTVSEFDPVAGTPPKRRSLRLNSSSAASRSPSLKSGHIRSTKTSSA